MKSHAFTLVEITVVLLIAGIAAATVTLKMSGPVARVKLQDVLEQIKLYDGNTRSYARQQGKVVRLDVDLTENSIMRLTDDDKQAGRPLELPDGFKIEKFIIASEDGPADATSLKISRDGFGRSYAMKIADKLQSKWIFFIGLTGQAIELDNEQNVREIMEKLSRNNAD